MRRIALVCVLLAGLCVLPGVRLMSDAEAFSRVDAWDLLSAFNYCTDGVWGSAWDARLGDAAGGWTSRSGLTATDRAVCDGGDPAGTVKLYKGWLPNEGIAAARHDDIFGDPVEIEFNTADYNWYTGTDSSWADCANKPDFWGVATHEFGHIYGFRHFSQTQEADSCSGYCSSVPTMHPGHNNTSLCNGDYARDLSSDDEAIARWTAGGNYMPNNGFESGSDSLYWDFSGASRDCTVNAYAGDCVAKISGGDSAVQKLWFIPTGQEGFRVWLATAGVPRTRSVSRCMT